MKIYALCMRNISFIFIIIIINVWKIGGAVQHLPKHLPCLIN